jgi:hypothetical protein
MMTNVVEGSEMAKVVKGKKITSIYHLWVAGTAIAILASSAQALRADAEPEALPRCADIEGAPQCPIADEVERNGVLVFVDFDQANFGARAQENVCVCGNTVLVDCDETQPADGEDTCAGGQLQELPVTYELIKNPASTVCKTVDGERICKKTPD